MPSKITGDDNFDSSKVGLTELWAGTGNTGDTLTLSDSILNYDLILITAITVIGATDHLNTVYIAPVDLATGKLVIVGGYTAGGTTANEVLSRVALLSNTTLTVSNSEVGYSADIIRVSGINFGRT